MSELQPPSPIELSRQADRPRAHKGSSDAEATIFAATERLLADVPVHDLSVAQIIEEAGMSRATFYFYFSSKFAVIAGLLASVMQEIFESVTPFVDRDPADDPETALRKSLDQATTVWSEHRVVLRATAQHWHAVPELGALWLDVVDRFTVAVAAELDRERAAGTAPDGPPSRQLAASLLWGTEAILHVAGLGVDDDLPNEKAIVDTLVRMWIGTLYVGGPTTKGRGAAKAKPATRRKPAAKAKPAKSANASSRRRRAA
jgi:TetR/AcrR family transcriptional regulator, ethionamide resistance regulator